MKTRTPWQVTRSVWYAMFMREALARTTADRFAWFWMLAEPIAMIVIMTAIRTLAMGGGKHISGAEFVPWIITGLFGFYLFRENMMRSLGAVGANQGLFAYRQVKTVDPVLIRCFLEGMLKTFIFMLFIFAGLLLDIGLMPADPLGALFDWLSLWMLGLGTGLTLSALDALVPETGRVMRILSFPLLIISGVILPLNFIPHDLRVYVLWNPIVHGLESLRLSFFPAYRSLDGVDLTYLWFWALSLITLGLILHLRFAMRLKAQ
ncbi:ABC transporter permease [Marinobacterium sedimentorum]|uniref:ABC transporter permease n=1 Tax=Marinobacterium sedimentorum TaxID=2927804 RepID=UPI002795AEED|nr:ABC transporter permease [Marinobacterium sedimentorum]